MNQLPVKVAVALIAAQDDLKNVIKDRKNPMFKSNYATLDNVIAVTRPILAKHKLGVIQMIEGTSENPLLITTIFHESGESISSRWECASLPGNRGTNPMQALGSTLTYARRYALMGILNLGADNEDDDGNSSNHQRRHKPAVNEIQARLSSRKTQAAEAGINPTTLEAYFRSKNLDMSQVDNATWTKSLERIKGPGRAGFDEFEEKLNSSSTERAKAALN